MSVDQTNMSECIEFYRLVFVHEHLLNNYLLQYSHSDHGARGPSGNSPSHACENRRKIQASRARHEPNDPS